MQETISTPNKDGGALIETARGTRLETRSENVGSEWDSWLERMDLYLDLSTFVGEGSTADEKAANVLKKKKQTRSSTKTFSRR